MRADVSQMIEMMDALRKDTDEVTEGLTRILDRGNLPSTSLVDRWSENSTRAVQLLPEMSVLAARLEMDIENVSEEDTQELLKSQDLFRASQERQGVVILRTKKALGLI